MKILNKKILNKAAFVLIALFFLIANPVSVGAYTDLNGFPFLVDDFKLVGYQYDDNGSMINSLSFYGDFIDQSTYYFDIDQKYNFIDSIAFGNNDHVFLVPFNLDLYDYYFVGSFYSSDGGWTTNDFDFSKAYFYTNPPGGTALDRVYSYLLDIKFLDFISEKGDGFSFYSKIDVSETSNLSYVRFLFSDNNLSLSGDCWFSASIVPILKSADSDGINESILQELVKINQNLVSLQSLQQSTIDAINKLDDNQKSWFQQLIQSMGIGFSALYEQMTKEQDEQLYGYEDSTTADANTQFSSESDKLTTLEGELSDSSHQYVSDYTSEGFDLAILSTLGNSLLFVTTWFTNFWNIGGVFTAVLNFCLCISIVAFILRFRS